MGGDVAGFVVITLLQGIELAAGDCGKFTVAEARQRELGQTPTIQSNRSSRDSHSPWFRNTGAHHSALVNVIGNAKGDAQIVLGVGGVVGQAGADVIHL